MEYKDYLRSAAHVVPSARQLSWYETGFYAFAHFTVNTYTDLEWGLGNEPESIFNPTELDCDQWVESIKAAGMKGLILTAKHHDGFCLWPTKTTEHCVRNSPWKDGKGDVVKEAAEACKRGGIKFGVYLSPWDRNSSAYGTDSYNDFYCEQLTELLTGYGELFMVWFDGACGEGPGGKKQTYDFERYISLIRKYQPNACIFNDYGPDVRWCGNEGGQPRRSEWAVVPHDFTFRCEKQGPDGPMAGTLKFLYNCAECVGDTQIIQYAHGLSFCGAEIDMSIRPGWFYHEKEEPHSLERLVNTYINSVGANTSFNLNIPPMPNGKFADKDVARLKELGQALEERFGEAKKVPCKIEKLPIDFVEEGQAIYKSQDAPAESDTQCKFRLTLPEKTKIAYVELRENIAEGQRVELFRIKGDNHPWAGCDVSCMFNGYTIGNRKICPVAGEVTYLDIEVLAARDTVDLKDIIVYKA